jgi:hypothetical protein
MSSNKVLFDSISLLLFQEGQGQTINDFNDSNLLIYLLANLPSFILTLFYFSLYTAPNHLIQLLPLQQLKLVISAVFLLPKILEKRILFSRYDYNLLLFHRKYLYLNHQLLIFRRILFSYRQLSQTGNFLWISMIIHFHIYSILLYLNLLNYFNLG